MGWNIYPVPDLNGYTMEFGMDELFHPHFTEHVISYPCLDLGKTMLVKGTLWLNWT